MKERLFCGYCGNELGLGDQFLRELEVEGVEPEFAPMKYVQAPEEAYGDPIPICDVCRKGIEKNSRQIEEDLEQEKSQSRRAAFALLLLLAGFTVVMVLMRLVGGGDAGDGVTEQPRPLPRFRVR